MVSFQERFHAIRHKLTERHIKSLATSYWCDRSHLEFLLRCRGMKIKDGVLKLRITHDLLDRIVDSGPNVEKLD